MASTTPPPSAPALTAESPKRALVTVARCGVRPPLAATTAASRVVAEWVAAATAARIMTAGGTRALAAGPRAITGHLGARLACAPIDR